MKKHELIWILLSSIIGIFIGANLGVFLSGVEMSLAIRVSASIGLGTGMGIVLGRTMKKY